MVQASCRGRDVHQEKHGTTIVADHCSGEVCACSLTATSIQLAIVNCLFVLKLREKDGHCFASMLAMPATYSKLHDKHVQTFAKQQGFTLSSDRVLLSNEQVIISHQDGSGWAVAMGTITNISVSAGEVQVMMIDKPVPASDYLLYRIDKAPGYIGGAMASNLADFCSSDSER